MQHETDVEWNWTGLLAVAVIVLGMVGCVVSENWMKVELARIKSHEAGTTK